MTPDRFTAIRDRLGLSGRAFARALGISHNSQLLYAREGAPRTVALAAVALAAGLDAPDDGERPEKSPAEGR